MSDQPGILIVDDEEKICRSCCAVLHAAGWLTDFCCDGTAGLNAYSEFRPDVVLLDLKMPDLDGHSVLKRILKLDGDAVVVVITGYATIQSAVDSIKSGAFDFLPKPFTPEELRMITGRALTRRRLLIEAGDLRREKGRMREKFIAMVSHQLRAPLVAIKQYHSVLLDEIAGPLAPGQQDILRRSEKRIEEMLRLIRDWLAMSRMDGNTVRAEMASFDLVPLLRNILDMIRTTAEKMAVDVTPPPEASFPVRGVRDLLREALVNVLINAVVYNRKGGRVLINLEKTAGEIRIKISDTGIGIPAEDRERIFDEFYRSFRSRGIPGTGLGLAIVKRILELHAGTAAVKSSSEAGTTVILCWPE